MMSPMALPATTVSVAAQAMTFCAAELVSIRCSANKAWTRLPETSGTILWAAGLVKTPSMAALTTTQLTAAQVMTPSMAALAPTRAMAVLAMTHSPTARLRINNRQINKPGVGGAGRSAVLDGP